MNRQRNELDSPTQQLYDSMEIAYRYFNQQLFNNKLPKVIFTTQRSGLGILGHFASDRWKSIDGTGAHEISINPTYIARSCQMDVISTLVHEMAHCWQQCFGKPGRGGYHNKEWAYKMADIGLMPSNTSEPGGDIVGEQMSHYIIRNGPFFNAYQNLVTQENYGWRWIDTRATPIKRDITVVDVENPRLLIQKPKTTPVSIVDWDDLDESRFGNLMDDDAINDWKPDVNKNKITYCCSSCDMRVWGKPNLSIICGECDLELNPQ